ncbi:hypothetical protein AVEN_55079-1, partial [Araneus ventricosus]
MILDHPKGILEEDPPNNTQRLLDVAADWPETVKFEVPQL